MSHPRQVLHFLVESVQLLFIVDPLNGHELTARKYTAVHYAGAALPQEILF